MLGAVVQEDVQIQAKPPAYTENAAEHGEVTYEGRYWAPLAWTPCWWCLSPQLQSHHCISTNVGLPVAAELECRCGGTVGAQAEQTSSVSPPLPFPALSYYPSRRSCACLWPHVEYSSMFMMHTQPNIVDGTSLCVFGLMMASHCRHADLTQCTASWQYQGRGAVQP
jgi:hypothetical protein